ncbi:hypothetical protein [Oceaniovalibus sp. ACAM 378]|uniref:hypothetical protein n=1 Tax=Oceaniovalibus sp. ACAM 378 TaxID=2599923 RepID=UPI0011DB8910|nr:hypothetical protein [Oceaniovalibus sp. ACAM 378]TYB83925.1 hypothetical protein FQ320_23500 [Oceaniovalibus sp. ACAM 378]
MFKTGDVVRFFSPTAGKEKFHLCLGHGDSGPLFAFLYLNSGSGYRGDCVLEDGQIPGLPKSPTGESVVSFSLIIRMGEDRLKKFGAEKTGEVDAHLAGELAAFAESTAVLTRAEKAFVVGALRSLFS